MEKSKFQKFEANKLQRQFHILGGLPQASTYKSGSESGSDCVDFDTKDQTAQSGLQWDYRRGACSIPE